MYPLRFLTNIYDIGVCNDYSKNNIIYIGNYVLFRPSYERGIQNDGYNYSNLILVDLDNSYIDVNKFYSLLAVNNIEITTQKHILYKKHPHVDIRWIKLLEQSSVTKFLEIPNTNACYLKKIQYDNINNTLLVTHNISPDVSNKYTLVDLKTLTIINCEHSIEKAVNCLKTNNIVFDCIFNYCEYEEDILSNNYDNIDYNNIECNIEILKNTLQISKYTHILTSAINANELLFIEDGVWDISPTLNFKKENINQGAQEFDVGAVALPWSCNPEQTVDCCKTKIQFDAIQKLIVSQNITYDMQHIINKYLIHDIYSYVNKLNKLMQLLYKTSPYYLEYEPNGNIQMFAINYNILHIMSGMGGLRYGD